jgi:hypothetical protein
MNDDNKNAGVNKRPDVANIKIKRPPSNHIIINNNNNNVQLQKPHSNHHINIKNDLYGKNNYSHQININNNNFNTPSNVQKPQPEQEKKPDSNKIKMFLAPKSSEISSKKSTNVTGDNSSNNNSNPSNKVVSNKEKQPQLVSKKSAPNKVITPAIKLDENKPKNPKIIDNNHNLPRNNIPSIIIVDKHPIDDYQKEEQYNQHRYFNILNQIRNEIKEDPELYFDDDDEDEPPKPIREVSNQQEIFQGLSSNYLPPSILSAAPNVFSDFSEIESIREKLENKLGMTLLKEVINFVDSITDHETIKFDYEKIEELKMKLEPRYSVDKINTAIDHVHEVFTIILKERVSNSK